MNASMQKAPFAGAKPNRDGYLTLFALLFPVKSTEMVLLFFQNYFII